MNIAQLTSLIRKALTLFGAYLIQNGHAAAGTFFTGEDFIGLCIFIVGLAWSHYLHADEPTTAVSGSSGAGGSKTMLAVALALGLAIFTGCTSIINDPNGKIVSITERGVGFVVAESPTTQTPAVKFGFFSSAVVLLPTSTNAPINSPNFANTFDFAQSGAMSLGIGEDIASGNYQTSKAGQTNSAPTTQPITPK